MYSKFRRPFLVALFGEALIVTIASLGGKRTNPWEVFRITTIWATAFAVLTGTTVALAHSFIANRVLRPRFTSLSLSISLAGACYFLALVLTGGYILNVQYPLFIVFLSGSVPAFVDAFWPSKSIAAAVSILVILTIGFSGPALLWITKRRQPVRITFVKLTPQASPDLKITWQPDSEPDEFERAQLRDLGLHGEARMTHVYDLGPHVGTLSHTMIVLTRPPVQEVHLGEGKGNLVYLQRDSTWQKVPPDASVSWRKIEMYQTSSNCAAVQVWYRLDEQSGAGGPCWDVPSAH
jgi:hypothetical protein